MSTCDRIVVISNLTARNGPGRSWAMLAEHHRKMDEPGGDVLIFQAVAPVRRRGRFLG